MRVEFPTIPEVADGMVGSAATFNTWSSALTYLLGESHAPFASTYTDRGDKQEYRATYQSVSIGYAPYRGEKTLFYAFDVRQNSGGANYWHVRIGFYGDDSAWHWVYETAGTDGSWAHRSGTHALTAGEQAQLTYGHIYEWRVQLRGDNETYNTYLRLWQIGLLAAIKDWPSAPTFIEGGVPDAAAFNTIKTAAETLADFVPAINWCGGGEPVREWNHTSWGTVQRGVIRYRPESLLCVVRYRQRHGYDQRKVRWQVQVRDTAGHEAVVYESSDLATTGGTEERSQEIDLTTGAAAAALAAAGITLTMGSLYRVTIRIRRVVGTDAEVLDVYGGMIIRTSAGTPAGGWVTPALWKHLDNDVGPTKLNAYWTDLTLLRSGAEALHGHTPVMCHMFPEGGNRSLHGIRRKRWLHYQCVNSNDAPRIYYGAAHGQEQTLEAGAGWQTYDLEQIAALPYGATYWLSRTLTAFEADTELL